MSLDKILIYSAQYDGFLVQANMHNGGLRKAMSSQSMALLLIACRCLNSDESTEHS